MRSRRLAGVTLIEAMAAIAITAIVAAMLYGGFSQTARNKERIEQDTERYHLLRMAMERMVRELSAAYVSAQLNPSPDLQVVQTAFVGKDGFAGDRLDFNSFSHHRLYRNAHESDQNEISYFVARDPEDSSRRVLARREANRPDDNPREGGDIRIVLWDVEDFQLQYLDPISKEWVDTWDTMQATGQPNRLPAQVKITIELAHPRQHLRERGLTQTFATRATINLVHGLNHASYNP